MNTKENLQRLLKEIDTITNGNFRIVNESPLTLTTSFGPHTKVGGLLARLKMTSKKEGDSWLWSFGETLPPPKKKRKFYHTSKMGELWNPKSFLAPSKTVSSQPRMTK